MLFDARDPIFQTVQVGSHGLPGLWQFMLPQEFLWLRLPLERLAKCDNCPKVITHNYRPEYKCCTYFPQISNFMIGLALLDPASQQAMQHSIDCGHALPEGTQATPTVLRGAADEFANNRFGKTDSVACPYIHPTTHNCQIYPYRNSICSTFFCENDHGEPGTGYWEKVQAFTGQVEIALSQWAMEQVGFSANAYIERLNQLAGKTTQLTDAKTNSWSTFALKHLWANRYGKERDFFVQCAEVVVANKDQLYEIACQQKTTFAFQFDRAVEQLIPEEQRNTMQCLPENPGEPAHVSDLWYQLDLATRRLWELPYHRGKIRLADNITFAKTDPTAPQNVERKTLVAQQEQPDRQLFVDQGEHNALMLLRTPHRVGERLLETPEMQALPDAKGFLAECLRQNVLLEE